MLSFVRSTPASRLVAILILLLWSAGCGDSSRDSVAPIITSPNAGSVTFQLARAGTEEALAAAFEVPETTTTLRFAFFTQPDGAGLQSQATVVREFAPQITLSPVSTSTRSVLVSALDDEGEVLLAAVANITVPANGNTTASLTAVSNEDPSLQLGDSRLELAPTIEQLNPFAQATVDDDQSQLAGGQLRLELHRDPTSSLVLGDVSSIGRLGVSENVGEQLIELNEGASLQSVSEFLRGVVVRSAQGQPLQEGFVTVGLSDGRGGEVDSDETPAAIFYSAAAPKALTLFVPGQYPTITAAIARIEQAGARKSTIKVAEGDFSGEGLLRISDAPNLQGLTIEGAYEYSNSSARTTIAGLEIDNQAVRLYNMVVVGDSPQHAGILLSDRADDFIAQFTLFQGPGASVRSTAITDMSVAAPVQGMGLQFCTIRDWDFGIDLRGRRPIVPSTLDIEINHCRFENNGTAIRLANIPQPAAEIVSDTYFSNSVGGIHMELIAKDGQVYKIFNVDLTVVGALWVDSEGDRTRTPAVTLETQRTRFLNHTGRQLIDNPPREVIRFNP